MVWLIRHGESQSNAGEVTQSTRSSALTATGRRQAERVATQFTRAPDLIVVSGYLRTHQTAQPLRDRFPQVPVEEWPIHEFTYLSPPRYDGTTYDQRVGSANAYWERCASDHCDGEGAETFDLFMMRVRNLLARLRTGNSPFTAVFVHGYVMKAAIWEVLYAGDRTGSEYMKSFRAFHQNFPIGNGDILPVMIDPDDRIFFGPLILYPSEKSG